MIVTQKKLITYMMDDVPGLDPITVTVEDIRPGRGSICISCYGKSWTAYWNGMGDRTVCEFFVSASSSEYLVGCLDRQLYSTIPDPSQDSGAYDCIQHIENPAHAYLTRVVEAVQAGLKLMGESEVA